ncbi:MAG: hypothetical protein V1689_04410 [Pseudomonadota bacterium]
MAAAELTSLKKACRWFIIVVLVMIASYLCFVSLVFIWVGLTHSNRSGFWVPILAGALSLGGISWIIFRIIRRILYQMKEKALLNI